MVYIGFRVLLGLYWGLYWVCIGVTAGLASTASNASDAPPDWRVGIATSRMRQLACDPTGASESCVLRLPTSSS